MSEAVAFDSHRFVKNLTGCGFTERQAEVLAAEQVRLLEGNLATKTDIAMLGRATKTDIAMLGRATKTDIAMVKADIATLGRATKTDIAMVKAELQAEIQHVKAGLQVEIQKVKSDLLKWMVGAMTAQAAVIIGFITLLG